MKPELRRILRVGTTLGAGSTALALILVACSSGSLSKTGKVPVIPAAVPPPVLTQSGNLTREEAANRFRQVAHVHYNLWFGLDSTHEDFDGRAVVGFEVRAKAKDYGAEIFVDLDGATIQSFNLNGALMAAEQIKRHYDGHRLRLPLSDLLSGANRLEIAYSGKYGTDGSGLARFKDPRDAKVYLYSNLEPYSARKVFPCFDQPDIKASYELTAEAPADWHVIANTLEREVTTVDGRKSWQFPPSPLFSTYVFALHAGPYHMWEEKGAEGLVPLRLFARKSLESAVDAPKWFELTRLGMTYFKDVFGTDYPFAKYDLVLAPELPTDAMENLAAPIFSEKLIFDPRRSLPTQAELRERADTLMHELAHMWFGDLVTPRWWTGLWLNESFATYMGAEAVESATVYRGAWRAFFSDSKLDAYRQDQSEATHAIEGTVHDTLEATAKFDSITYGKGAAALRQLEANLGQDDFREGLQRYFQKFSYRNATTGDFLKKLSEASGKSLLDWQKAWLHTAGVNSIEAAWTCGIPQPEPEPSPLPGAKPRKARRPRHEGPVILSFKLRQRSVSGNAIPQPHHARVLLYRTGQKLASRAHESADGEKTTGHSAKMGAVPLLKDQFLEVDFSQAETDVADAVGIPCPDFVFPNADDLDYVLVKLDPKSMEYVRDNLGRLPDPFLRQLVWHSLWESVLRQDLPPGEFLKLVYAQLSGEPDSQILEQVLPILGTHRAGDSNVLAFLSDSDRIAQQPLLAAWLRKGASNAAAGSDAQSAWMTAYLHNATVTELPDLKGLIAGKVRINGLHVDQDLRWDLLQALEGLGDAESARLLESERERDPSELGELARLRAEMVSTDPAVRAKWRGQIFDRQLKISQLRELMAAYPRADRPDELRAAIEPYFLAVEQWSAKEDADSAQEFAADLFPASCDPTVAKRTRDFISKHARLPAGVIENLRVAAQEEERCARIRTGAPAPAESKVPKVATSPTPDRN